LDESAGLNGHGGGAGANFALGGRFDCSPGPGVDCWATSTGAGGAVYPVKSEAGQITVAARA
jgi:hypothetical protein